MIFEYSDESKFKVVYLGEDRKPDPFFSAVSIEEFLGSTNPSSTASSRMLGLENRIVNFNKQFGYEFKPYDVTLVGSNKPAHMHLSDGTYSILAVMSSKNARARASYYYNLAALFYVLTTARTDRANVLQHWINGKILPVIYKTGEYIAVRKDSIGFRKHLTDAIKRRIDCQELDESAYPTITDAIYLIRYGMNAAQLRDRLGLGDSDNIREHLSEDELNAIALIENDLTGALNLGLSLSDVLANKAFVMLHRQPL